jgi:hypothetical protein
LLFPYEGVNDGMTAVTGVLPPPVAEKLFVKLTFPMGEPTGTLL